jgi:hypothetical protein
MRIAIALIVLLAALAAGCGSEQGRATPAGYWEGTARASDIPMKDTVRTLTRSADAEFWFTVNWDAGRGSGTISGEAEAKYDAELKVDNLPKVTVPTPGGSVKFEPSVGGKLTDTDNRRKFPIVGVITVDPSSGNGTLILQKVNAPPGTAAQQADRSAGGSKTFDAPMEFTLRADPGVSGSMGGPMGSVGVASSGRVTAGAMGAEASAGGGNVIVQKIPMTPYSPFAAKPGKVEKRPGGPFVASFEEKSDKHTFKWSAKQVGGEKREAPRITPEMQKQIDELSRLLGQRR